MALNNYKLGELIERLDLRNEDATFGEEDVAGISTQKNFIETKADLNGVNLKSYKIVQTNNFAYVPDTSRRGDKISLAFNNSIKSKLVSSIYEVFKVARIDILLPEYLFMYFNRPEFDRYSRFNSWGSARETFDWEDMCSIEIELPNTKTQQKFVDIYNAILINQQSYEQGLDDLKLVCDAYIENLKRNMSCKKIGGYITCTDRKTDNPLLKIQGISKQHKFTDSNSRVDGVETTKYLRIDPREFGYSPIHINDGSIAFNDADESYLLSPIYKTFKVINEEELFPEYLMMWLSRDEFTRYCWFFAYGSARDTFAWEQLCDVQIPIPSIDVQKSIANVYKTYVERKNINESLKAKIANICSVLIKGSFEFGD